MKKRVIILSLLIASISMGIMGCGSSIKVNEGGTNQENNMDNLDFTVAEIERDKEFFNVIIPEKDGFYAIELSDEYGMASDFNNRKVYKISDDNKVNELTGKNTKYIKNSGRANNTLAFEIDDTGTIIESVVYLESFEKEAKKLFDLEKKIKLEPESVIYPAIGKLNDEFGYYTIFNDEGSQIASGDKSLSKTEVLEIVNFKTGEKINVENDFKSIVISGVTIDNDFYMITGDFQIHKLEKQNDIMKVVSTINLMEKVKVDMNKTMSINFDITKNNEIIFYGSTFVEAPKEDSENNLIISEPFLCKYNLKTDKIEQINVTENKNVMNILNYKNDIILTSEFAMENGKPKEEYYLGVLDNGRIQNSKKIDINNKEGSYTKLISSVFNEDTNEIILQTIDSDDDNKSFDEKSIKYIKVKIEK